MIDLLSPIGTEVYAMRAAKFFHRFDDLFDEFEKGLKVSQGKAETGKSSGLTGTWKKLKDC